MTDARGPERPLPSLLVGRPRQGDRMPRYMVERTFSDGLNLPSGPTRTELCATVVAHNADEGVTWVHSYVSEDRERTYCVYDAPSPEAIRRTASRNQLPVERITQVSVLDPYFYQ